MEQTAEQTTEQPTKQPMEQHRIQGREDNVVYVGRKPTMGYVLAVVTQFSKTTAPEVIVKARGKLISRAVDVVEIVRSRFLTNVKIKGIEIKSEELTSEDGSKNKVSAIEISLQK